MRFGADQESQSLLPPEKRHLLFGIVAAEPTPRLFIKFEHNGIYAGTGLTGKLTNCGELLGHGFNYLVSRGTKLEKTMPEWWYNTLLKPIVGSDEGPEARREHPSVAFIRTCTAMLQNTPELSARYLPQLTNGGIRQLRDFVKHKPADLPDWLHQAFERYYQQLCRILDYPEIRKGCEVILGQDELFSSLYYHCFAHNQAEQATQAGLLYERLKKQHAIRTELNHIHSAIEDRLRENRPIEPELMQQAQATGQRLERYQAALQAVINQYQPTAH